MPRPAVLPWPAASPRPTRFLLFLAPLVGDRLCCIIMRAPISSFAPFHTQINFIGIDESVKQHNSGGLATFRPPGPFAPVHPAGRMCLDFLYRQQVDYFFNHPFYSRRVLVDHALVQPTET